MSEENNHIAQSAQGEEGCVIMPLQMTIETIEGVAHQCQQHHASPGMLRIDLSQVEYITTPGAQLLVAMYKAQAAIGGDLTLIKARPVIEANIRTLGLGFLLSQNA
jgi:anti-anti-sigma regulatory factor